MCIVGRLAQRGDLALRHAVGSASSLPPGVGRESVSVGAGEGSLMARLLARCSNQRFKSFLKPAMAHAEECGIAVNRYRQHLWSRGQALSQRLSENAHELMTKLCCSASAGGFAPGNVRPTLFVRQRKYDETNSVLACHFDQGKVLLDDDDPLLDEEVGPTKVFVTESQFAMVFASGVGEEAKALAVRCFCPALLQAVEKNSAECYVEALTRACGQPFDSLVDEKFERQVDVVCHDEHMSNGKAERGLTALHPTRAKLELLCDAHKKAAVTTKTFDLWRELPTQVIRLALSTRGGISGLRRAMRQRIKETLQILAGARSRDAQEYSTQLLSLYLRGEKPACKHRRIVLSALFNGDWRACDVVQFHDWGQIPGGRAAIERAFYTHGARALLPRSLKVFARNNWTGSGVSLDDIGLLTAIHGLLPSAYQIVYGAPAREPAAVAAAAAEAEARPPVRPDGEDEEDWVGPGARADLPATAGEGPSSWKEERSLQNASTKTWLSSGTAHDDVYIARVIHQPLEDTILQQLSVSGSEWERAQQQRYAQEARRSYQVLEAFDDEPSKKLSARVGELLFKGRSGAC